MLEETIRWSDGLTITHTQKKGCIRLTCNSRQADVPLQPLLDLINWFDNRQALLPALGRVLLKQGFLAVDPLTDNAARLRRFRPAASNLHANSAAVVAADGPDPTGAVRRQVVAALLEAEQIPSRWAPPPAQQSLTLPINAQLQEWLAAGLGRLSETRRVADNAAADPILNLTSYGIPLSFVVAKPGVPNSGSTEETLIYEPVSQSFTPIRLRPPQATPNDCTSLWLLSQAELFRWRYRSEKGYRQMHLDLGRVIGELVLSASAFFYKCRYDLEPLQFTGVDTERIRTTACLTVAEPLSGGQ